MKSIESKIIRTRIEKTKENEHSSPIFLTSSFQYDSAEAMQSAFAEGDTNIYSRYTNPNFNEFVDRLCIYENAESGHATASGMSAVFASFMTYLSAGDHLLACSSIFGSTFGLINNWLPKYGIETDMLSISNVSSWEGSFKKNTKVFYLETPTNPGLEIIDIQKIAELCKSNGVLLIVDNCFATPYLQQPLNLGADLSIHSATKFIDGQGRGVGGAVLGSKELIEPIVQFCRTTGPALSPFNAWMFSKSLETLAVRMDRHCCNAVELAKYLESHSDIKKVVYPFLKSHPQYDIAKKQMTQGGALVAFELKGGIEEGQRFLNSLKMSSLTANLGDTRTIVSHPASTTHSRMTEEQRLSVGISDSFIRVSCGLESSQDIVEDIDNALLNIK